MQMGSALGFFLQKMALRCNHSGVSVSRQKLDFTVSPSHRIITYGSTAVHTDGRLKIYLLFTIIYSVHVHEKLNIPSSYIPIEVMSFCKTCIICYIRALTFCTTTEMSMIRVLLSFFCFCLSDFSRPVHLRTVMRVTRAQGLEHMELVGQSFSSGLHQHTAHNYIPGIAFSFTSWGLIFEQHTLILGYSRLVFIICLVKCLTSGYLVSKAAQYRYISL